MGPNQSNAKLEPLKPIENLNDLFVIWAWNCSSDPDEEK